MIGCSSPSRVHIPSIGLRILRAASVAGFDFADAAKQLVGIGRRQRLDLPQLTGDRTRAHACLGDLLLRLVELRSEDHTSELQSLMRISYAVFCLKKKTR